MFSNVGIVHVDANSAVVASDMLQIVKMTMPMALAIAISNVLIRDARNAAGSTALSFGCDVADGLFISCAPLPRGYNKQL